MRPLDRSTCLPLAPIGCVLIGRTAFQEHLFAVMRFMQERKLNKKTQMRVIAYHNVLWQAYRHAARSLPQHTCTPGDNNTSNNNISHGNVYGAVIMTKVIARVHPVHLMNVD